MTVRTLLTMSQILSLTTAQIDYIAAFPQSDLKEDAYVKILRGFREDEYVLKLVLFLFLNFLFYSKPSISQSRLFLHGHLNSVFLA
jgi:hypothetical protein